MNKSEYDKLYYQKNKEKRQSQSRAWHNDNKGAMNERRSRDYYNQKDGFYSVYYLPEEHYVGMTENSLKLRMRQHRTANDRITEGYELLAKFERAVDAHMFETMLHQRGYHGFRR